jgi:hypothetical protein
MKSTVSEIHINSSIFRGQHLHLKTEGIFLDGARLDVLYEQNMSIKVIGNLDELHAINSSVHVVGNVEKVKTTSGDIGAHNAYTVSTVSGDVEAYSLLGESQTLSGDKEQDPLLCIPHAQRLANDLLHTSSTPQRNTSAIQNSSAAPATSSWMQSLFSVFGNRNNNSNNQAQGQIVDGDFVGNSQYTTNYSVDIVRVAGNVSNVRSVSGNIMIDGDVNAIETVSGDVNVLQNLYQQVSTVSGDISWKSITKIENNTTISVSPNA